MDGDHAAAPATGATSRLKKRVLMLMPDPVLGHALGRDLRHHGVHVVLVEDAGAAAMMQPCRPDAALVAADSPQLRARFMEGLREAYPGLRAIYYVQAATPATLVEAMSQGACALLTRDVAAAQLAQLLHNARSGPFFTHATLEPGQEAPEPRPAEDVRGRQAQVLRLTAQGFTSKEIAVALDLSPSSVDTYRRRLSKRLGFRHRSELVRYATMAGMMDPPTAGAPR